VETLDADNPKHARADDKLRHEIAAWLTTVTTDGQPQSTPIWFHWDGSTFLIYSQPDRPKLRNIAGNPKVSLHLVGDPDGEIEPGLSGHRQRLQCHGAARAADQHIAAKADGNRRFAGRANVVAGERATSGRGLDKPLPNPCRIWNATHPFELRHAIRGHPEIGQQRQPDSRDREESHHAPAPERQRLQSHSTPPRRSSRSWIVVRAKANAKSTIEAAAASPIRW
jgi:PPOX class probable F420-dependent enzyme